MAIGGLALLVNIMEHKQEAKNPFFRVVELTDNMEDPAVWGKNFPFQYDAYLRRSISRTRYGGSDAVPRTPTKRTRAGRRAIQVEEDPRLKKMWAGYAFAIDFREERGHAYMLDDQTYTGAPEKPQPGHLPELPRLDLLTSRSWRRRHRERLRKNQPRCHTSKHANCQASHRVHRLS